MSKMIVPRTNNIGNLRIANWSDSNILHSQVWAVTQLFQFYVRCTRDIDAHKNRNNKPDSNNKIVMARQHFQLGCL